MMMVVAATVEVSGFAWRARKSGNHSRLAQHLKRSIHGCEADAWLGARKASMQLLSSDILFCCGEMAQDDLALRGEAMLCTREGAMPGLFAAMLSFHRTRASVRRASSRAVSSDRRLGENAMAKKKQAVATSTIVAPDAMFR